jgi:acetyltransferase-like isoleucine patch superfamily enzyme
MKTLAQHRAQVSDLLQQAQALRTRLALRQCAEVGLAPVVLGTLWIHGGGTVRLGDRVRFNASSAPIELHTFDGAELCIGDDVCIEGGVSIEAHHSVTIGDGSVLEGYCMITDNHFHAAQGDRHRRPPSTPVVIEAGAIIGRRAIVFPGACVARGAVVRSGTLVRAEARSPLTAILNAPLEG